MSRLRQTLRFAIAILLACAATLAADPALPQDFPRLGHYGSIYGDGYPLVDSTGALDAVNIDRLARYDVVTLDASPMSEYRPDIAAALRQRNPDIVLLAYVNAHYSWFARQVDSLVHYPTRFNRTVRDLDGYLYNTNGDYYGTVFQQFANVNMAKRDLGGRYVVAEALADLFKDSILDSGIWDGIFLDTYCNSILWMEGFGEIIDYSRAGYPDRTSFDVAWKAGTDTLASRLRALAGPTPILAGNCAQGTKYAWFNGWMRENFPLQNGGTWELNMFRDPGGYFVDEARHLQPTYNWIFSSIWAGTDPYSPTNTRVARYGLASATLGQGYGVVGVPERQSRLEPYHEWWYDEYAVDLATGQASTERQHHRLARSTARRSLPDGVGGDQPRRSHEPRVRIGRRWLVAVHDAGFDHHPGSHHCSVRVGIGTRDGAECRSGALVDRTAQWRLDSGDPGRSVLGNVLGAVGNVTVGACSCRQDVGWRRVDLGVVRSDAGVEALPDRARSNGQRRCGTAVPHRWRSRGHLVR